jgi:peptide chain release factor 2
MWDDADKALKIMRERNHLAAQTEGLTRLETDVANALELIEMAEAEGDESVVTEAIGSLRELAVEAKRREIESLLSGEADNNDAYLEINAGAGGTEAQDWAEMLMRMYSRWAEKHGYKVELMEASA